MKLRYILFLLLALELVSCNKRYVNFKKIKVAYSPHQSTATVHKPILQNRIPETASVDTGLQFIANIPTVTEADVFMSHQSQMELQPLSLDSEKKLKSLYVTETKSLPADSSIEQSVARSWNKKTLISGSFLLVSIISGLLLLANPAVMLLVMGLLGIVVFIYACKGWKEMRTNNERGKGIAFMAMALGALSMFTLFTFIPAFMLSFSARTGQSFYNAWILLTVLMSAIAVYGEVHVKKIKPEGSPSSEEKVKPENPEVVTSPDSFNKTAVVAFISAAIFLLAAISSYFLGGALWGVLLLIAPVVALILGIIALRGIRKVHQKGKWMAWVSILAVPLLLLGFVLVATPILTLLALIVCGIYFMTKD